MTFLTHQGWTPRAKALEPGAVIACGSEALSLARRLRDRSDEELKQLRGVVSREGQPPILAVVGAFEHLPWTPGSVYLGHDGSCSNLLWPIHSTPPFAPVLVERALLRRFPALLSPLAVLPDQNLVISLGEALPVKRELLDWFFVGDPS